MTIIRIRRSLLYHKMSPRLKLCVKYSVTLKYPENNIVHRIKEVPKIKFLRIIVES